MPLLKGQRFKCYNHGMLSEKMLAVFEKECRLEKIKKTLVGVSGGPDSLCLSDILYNSGYPVIIAHFNHRLRADSDEDARKVMHFANERNLPFVIGQGDVAETARAEKLSLEEAARKERYHFLFDQARVYEAQAVVVAHNAEDQVETVLMHFLRGAGLAGLKGMSIRTLSTEWNAEIPLVRPFLGIWRAEILEYIQEKKLDPVYDSSNQDTTFFRNRLRHDLIPYLTAYNPQVKEVIRRMSANLSGDFAIVEEAIEESWNKCITSIGPGFAAFSIPILQKMGRGYQRGILRKAVTCLRPNLRDIDFDVIEKGADFVQNPTRTGRIDLASHLKLFIEGKAIYLADENYEIPTSIWPQISTGEEIPLPKSGRVELGSSWSVEVEEFSLKDLSGEPWKEKNIQEAWVNARTVTGTLCLRTSRRGDRFQPFGMAGRSTLLSDFWINTHIPRRARRDWPLVCCSEGNSIVWVPGLRLAEPFRVTQDTSQVVHLTLYCGSLTGKLV
jgi:tRNA(Ile)-lysidine synthase